MLAADKKSQIQALDRSQPNLPMVGAGTMTYDYPARIIAAVKGGHQVLDSFH